ncbi:MAG: biotin--[acetyl-CoA-carboxylase] ligase [Brooklawnia sp.]|jgi:BirA family biotin operon repressor/biotin-[acetyl-CoA-carboxylase] ligase
MPATTAANADRIAALLGPGAGWRVRCLQATGSTNADLVGLARDGEPAGLVLVAEHQHAGRGRFDRAWQSPPGSSVSVSALLRPRRPLRDWGWLSLLVGLAVADGIRSLGGGDRVSLKWPNDVLVDGRKICGILSERVPTSAGDAAVCGWGINVSMSQDELPVPHATSLLLAGLPTDKDELLAAVLRRLGELAGRWDAGEDLSSEYAAGCATVGRQVRVHLDEQSPDGPSVTGQAVGVGSNGEILVATGGRVREFAAGDVVHLR